MPDLTIGEVARRAGLSASAIRYWERRRLLPPPPRRGGRRCYDPAIVTRLRLLAAARGAGLAIAELNTLLAAADAPAARAAALADAAARVDGRIARLDRLRASLRELAACSCASAMACDLVAGR
jgi:DNA-binding transcriptional MerR regulator